MLDLKYYTQVSLPKEEDRNLVLKYFSKIKFNSLYDSIHFFKDIDKKVSFINTQADKDKLKEIAPNLVHGLESQKLNIVDFMNNQVYPNLNISEVLADLNPRENSGTTTLECPCCAGDEKKHSTKDQRDAYIVKISNSTQSGIIKCNRENKCGKSTNITKHVMDRDNVSFRQAITNLAKTVGIDFPTYERNNEMHVEDNGKLKKSSAECEKEALEIKNLAELRKKTKLGLYQIDFKKPDTSKSFKDNLDVSHLYAKYKELKDSHRVQLIYSYIKSFTMKEKDRGTLEKFFNSRGLDKQQMEGVGYLKASKVNKLVSELTEQFGKKDLVDFGITTEKYNSWRYKLLDKDEKFKYCDSAVFFMHDIYSDVPTNMEFKFFGEEAIGAQRKAVSMAQSEIVDSNYYGKSNNIDFIKNDKRNTLWWTEAVIDAKTLEQFGLNSNSLIGVGKHFSENLGYFTEDKKMHIIAFDEDKAGIVNSEKFAKKLRQAGAKNIFFATWDKSYGKDLNDLLISRDFDKIKLSFARFTMNKDEEINVSYDLTNLQSISQNIIEFGYSEYPKKDEVAIQKDIKIVKSDESVKPSIQNYMQIKNDIENSISFKDEEILTTNNQVIENQDINDIIINKM